MDAGDDECRKSEPCLGTNRRTKSDACKVSALGELLLGSELRTSNVDPPSALDEPQREQDGEVDSESKLDTRLDYGKS